MPDSNRIIIAEDNDLLATMLTRLILRRCPNAMVHVFTNGCEAFADYLAAGAHLLFCNHAMPGIDGPTLIRLVRARGDSVPMIGMSGDSSTHDDYLAAGANAFYGGSDLIEQLPAILQRYLSPAPGV